MLLLFLLLSLLLIIIFALSFNQHVYCFVFEHKEWKNWHYIFKHINDFSYQEKVKEMLVFKDKKNLTIYVMPHLMKSIGFNTETLQIYASMFYRPLSKKVAKVLYERAPKN